MKPSSNLKLFKDETRFSFASFNKTVQIYYNEIAITVFEK